MLGCLVAADAGHHDENDQAQLHDLAAHGYRYIATGCGKLVVIACVSECSAYVHPGVCPVPAKAIVQSLLAILLWSVLAFLALQLSRMPPFLLIGIAHGTGALCGVHRISQWRVPLRVLLLGVYGLFGFHFCLFMALRLAPTVEANLINYLWPLLIVVLTPLFLRGYTLRARHIAAAWVFP